MSDETNLASDESDFTSDETDFASDEIDFTANISEKQAVVPNPEPDEQSGNIGGWNVGRKLIGKAGGLSSYGRNKSAQPSCEVAKGDLQAAETMGKGNNVVEKGVRLSVPCLAAFCMKRYRIIRCTACRTVSRRPLFLRYGNALLLRRL